MKKLVYIFTFVMFLASAYAQAEVIKLEPIVVTATRDNSLVENYPGSVQVITKQEIENTPAKDIVDVLKSVAGIGVDKRSSEEFDIDIRGFNNGAGNGSRMILLINGMPIKNGDGYLDWQMIELDNIEKIEIIRGNAGSIYGDGAISGVINIITSDKPLKSYSMLKIEYGSYNKFSTSFSIKKRIRNGFYNIKGNFDKSKGYRINNEYEKKNVILSVSHFLNPKTEIEGNINYIKANYTYPGALTSQQMAEHSDRWSASPDLQNYNFLLLNGKVNHIYSKKFNMNIQFGYKNRYYEYPNWGSKYTNSIYIMEMQGRAKFKNSTLNNRIIGGVAFKKEQMGTGSTKMDSQNVGSYLKDELSFYKIVITADYRFDLIENLYEKVSTKTNKKLYRLDSFQVGAIFKFNKYNRIYLTGSKNVRTPTRDEIFNFFTGDLSLISPEIAYNYEAGANISPINSFRINASLFYMPVKNEIMWNGSVNTNIKEVTHKGIESEIEFIPVSFAKFNLAYTYQQIYFSEGIYKNKTVPLSPENRIYSRITLFPLKNVIVSHISHWRDKCYVANDLKNEKDMLNPYWVSDLKIMYKNEKVKAEFNIYNLYNEKYSEYAGVAGDIGYYPSDRRNYDLSVSLYF